MSGDLREKEGYKRPFRPLTDKYNPHTSRNQLKCVAHFGGNAVVVAVSVSEMTRRKDGGQERTGLKDFAHSTCLGFSGENMCVSFSMLRIS